MDPLKRILKLDLEERRLRGLLHTPAEIAQQPATWQTTWSLFQQHRTNLQSFLKDIPEKGRTVFLVGAGTSDYIGYALAPLLRSEWGCEVIVAASTDLLTSHRELLSPERQYLWISFSRSGESPEGIAVLEQALDSYPNVLHLVISCNAQGRMVQLAEESKRACAVVLDDAVNDRSLAMTSSFTNMVIFGQALAMLWGEGSFESTLMVMSTAAEFLLDQGPCLAEALARSTPKRACFVGSGSLQGTARESALKLLELTNGSIETMAESTLGLRHGPMSALNVDTVFTSFISTEDNRHRYDLDLIDELRAKQAVGTIVVVGGATSAADHVLACDSFCQIPDAFRAPVDVIFGQLFGLFASIEEGCQPDSPSPGGIISRVVPRFNIYR